MDELIIVHIVYLWRSRRSHGKVSSPWIFSSTINLTQTPVYLIFTIWDAFETVMIYFFVVETKNLTLEEITEVFEQ